MLVFQATVRPHPGTIVKETVVLLDGERYAAVRVAPATLARAAFARSFDQVVAALEALPRMNCEPDGSFVWSGSSNAATWQVDGNCYDQGRDLAFVEIKGRCPPAEFDRLLATLGWPATELLFETTPEASLLEEAEFRRFALACGQAAG